MDKPKIYEVQFGGSILDPADDELSVYVELLSECDPLGNESDAPERMFKVPMDAVWDWIMQLLGLPDITEETTDVIDGVIYPYLERTHYYTGKTVNEMLAFLSKHAKSDQKPVEE